MTIYRTGKTLSGQASSLNFLSELPGTWVGQGFNLISLPDFDKNAPSTGPKPFRVLLNTMNEVLTFTPIGGPVPNRGSAIPATGDGDGDDINPNVGQNDIELTGVRYLQQISDLNTNEPIHQEPGFWLNVPPTNIPQQPQPTIFRQGSIPHGTSILAVGNGSVINGKPTFPVISSTPFKAPNNPAPKSPLDADYLAPLTNAPLPPPFTNRAIIQNPNLVLSQANASFAQFITSTTVLQVATAPAGGILNIPFLQNATNNNAAILNFSATFWIETVQPPNQAPFFVLQYSQTIILNFIGIDWPHITVATLFLQ